MKSFAELFTQDAVDSYWTDAKRPLACLMFLLPLLAVYEVGVLWIGGEQAASLRNGADFWMRDGLEWLGLELKCLLPVLLCLGLLGWHSYRRDPWRVSRETYYGMIGESVLFAFMLVFVGQFHDLVFRQLGHTPNLEIIPVENSVRTSRVVLAISFLGAGVYEETMFRLCLLPAMFASFRWSGMPNAWAGFLAIFATSLFFSSAHYLGAAADSFTLFTFSFRIVAGLLFASLFVMRGFGITVGCHAFYDLLVGVLMQPETTTAQG